MKNDRLGLLLIAASVVAIATVGGLAWQYQVGVHRAQSRVHGVAITRAISNSDAGADLAATMRSLVTLQDNDDFAYLAVVSRSGEKLQEITAPGGIVPAATMPLEPYAWFGEQSLVSPGDDRPISEYFAPLMTDGQLAGFVRAGYYANAGIPARQLSSFALMALPIFLLTTLSLFLIRRQIKPLSQLGEKMAAISAAVVPGMPVSFAGGDYSDFIQRFDRFIQLVQSRVQNLNSEVASSQTNARLISYQQEKTESALNSLPDALLVLDDTGVATYANQKLESLLNKSRQDILGRPPQDWCSDKEVVAFLARHTLTTSSLRTATLDYVSEAAPERRMQVCSCPLLSTRDRSIVFGTLFAFRDRTREHIASQAGSDFVSHVAHELKTPLHTLLGYSELLLDRAALPEAQIVNSVNVIHSEVERMARQINNLLNITKMESGTLKPERTRVKLHDLLRDAFEGLRNSSLGKDVELELAVPPDLGSVRLDKELFRVAIDNLLSNAVKYSNPGGKVTVTAMMLDDAQVQIRVRDRGIGIAPEDRERIFARHFRAANRETAERSGHGLGLYLARQIIELHHGSISVNSELGRGTEFVVTIKAQPMQLEMAEAV